MQEWWGEQEAGMIRRGSQGKWGAGGSWHLLSCSTHLLVLEWVGFWNSAELWDFFFFFLFLFGLPVLTEDSHLEFHEPALHLASAHVCLGLVREWAGIKTSGKRRAPQQRAWNVLNEALSVWGNQQNCVYSCKSHLGNQQSQRSLKLLGVCYDGAAWSMNTNTTSVSVCVYTEIMLCVHFAHVLGSTYFYTKKEAISLT